MQRLFGNMHRELQYELHGNLQGMFWNMHRQLYKLFRHMHRRVQWVQRKLFGGMLGLRQRVRQKL